MSKHTMYALANRMHILRQITFNLPENWIKAGTEKDSCWTDQSGKLNSGPCEVGRPFNVSSTLGHFESGRDATINYYVNRCKLEVFQETGGMVVL